MPDAEGQAEMFAIPSPPTGSQVIDDRCVLRIDGDRRMVIVSGIVLAHYAVGDRIAEAHARVSLVDQGWADQNDVARAFGCSVRTERREQQRFDDGRQPWFDRAEQLRDELARQSRAAGRCRRGRQ